MSMFLPEITKNAPHLSSSVATHVAKFADILHRENQLQNLTRIIGPESFYDGHLLDVIQLFHVEQALKWKLGPIVMDLGSGCGVPGLLAAVIDDNPSRKWLLVESENKKAEYLKRASDELLLSNVGVIPKRAEEIVRHAKVDTILARAVGTIDKIAEWVWDCSTWNNIILFKSKGWVDEWEEAQKTKYGKKLTVVAAHEYSSNDKYRVLVNLRKK